MQKPDIWRLVLACLLPAKSEFSANDWRLYVNRYILPEIRSETIRFYGNTDSVEARHPGLDYASPAHRLRLGAYPRHSQLFAIFDRLKLTSAEISSLCKWEGTKQEKEDFERRMHVEIKDTTWDDVNIFRRKPPMALLTPIDQPRPTISHNAHREGRASALSQELVDDLGKEDTGDLLDTSDEESEDEIQRSVGLSLNERLLAATEARARGEDAQIDPAWEQWMKEALERGALLERGPAPITDRGGLLDRGTQTRLTSLSLPSISRALASTSQMSAGGPNSQASSTQPLRQNNTEALRISNLLDQEISDHVREHAHSSAGALQAQFQSSLNHFSSTAVTAASRTQPPPNSTTISPAVLP